MVKRWHLSKKEIKKLRKQVLEMYGEVPLEFNSVEKVVEKNYPEIMIVDGIPSFFLT